MYPIEGNSEKENKIRIMKKKNEIKSNGVNFYNYKIEKVFSRCIIKLVAPTKSILLLKIDLQNTQAL